MTQVQADQPVDLRTAFPNWSFWRGRDARGNLTDWYATRKWGVSVEQTGAHAGLERTVGAASAKQLRVAVQTQDERRAELGLVAKPESVR
ncbi:hypothetical protein [Nonomuraea typhae]|uniref:hypothetical protein n=1 Tax=Nonomuraea typhae TaxID=2603600 RepID=UPI0012F91AA5|nr:hypothetical protein [Nonomuraea typhae]